MCSKNFDLIALMSQYFLYHYYEFHTSIILLVDDDHRTDKTIKTFIEKDQK